MAWVVQSPFLVNDSTRGFVQINRDKRFPKANRRALVRPHVSAIIEKPKLSPVTKDQVVIPDGARIGFKTVTEVHEPIHLDVIGELPSYLGTTGAYYQIGPGVFEAKHKDGQDFIPKHWFDAIGMVHAFFFDSEANSVQYRNKVTSQDVLRAIESVPKDKYVWMQTQKSQELKPFGKLRHMLGLFTKDPESGRWPVNVNVTLQDVPGKGPLNASTDFNVLHRLDPKTLENIETYDFGNIDPSLNGLITCSHGIKDESTGEYFNFTVELRFGKVMYTVYRITPSGEVEILARFKDYLYLIHSFALTENYLIMIICPNQLNTTKALMNKSIVDACYMRPKTVSKFVVISRKHRGIVAMYTHPQFFYLHTINAYERRDEIVIDLSWYKTNDYMKELTIESVLTGGYTSIGKPKRFRLSGLTDAIAAGPFSPRQARSQTIADVKFELPVIAPGKMGKPYRYSYGTSDAGNYFWGDVKKIDMQTGMYWSWSDPGVLVGEPTFVPDPNGVLEDDGCVIAVGLDTNEQRSFLLILDARTMTEQARAIAPMGLPLAFHGTYRN